MLDSCARNRAWHSLLQVAGERLRDVHHVQSVLEQNTLQLRIAHDLPLVLRILQVLVVTVMSRAHVLLNVLPDLLRVLMLTPSRNSHGCSAAHVRAHEIGQRLVHGVLLGVAVARLRLALCRLFLRPRRSLPYFFRGRFGRFREVLLHSLLLLTPAPKQHHNAGNGHRVRFEHLLHRLVVDDGPLVVGVLQVLLVDVLPNALHDVRLRLLVLSDNGFQCRRQFEHLAGAQRRGTLCSSGNAPSLTFL